jgi:hypothetical protein
MNARIHILDTNGYETWRKYNKPTSDQVASN